MKPQITGCGAGTRLPVATASKELRHEAADHEGDRVLHLGLTLASKELRHEAADHEPRIHAATASCGASKELRHEAADHKPTPPNSCRASPASKELRHEAADHTGVWDGSFKIAYTLQKSCGMKPQITSSWISLIGPS